MTDKRKYDSEYIAYVKNGDSAAVFIVRDIVKSIDTTNKWIDIIHTKGFQNKDSIWDFSEIIVELFPRKKKPIYPGNVSDEDKKYITWKTAHEDISDQRAKGYKGPKYKVCPKLVNMNKGKTRTTEKIWNKKFQQYVPKHWARSSDCEIRKVKIPLKPQWEYYIISANRL